MASDATATNRPIKLFYSYSHEDEPFLEKLEKHLSILRRQRLIASWHDRKIAPGSEWAGQIDEHLESAQVILLLVSADFLASDYCYDKEMTRALERHDARQTTVIPIILRPVLWKEAPFAKLQALPQDGKPVADWDNQDKAFKSIAEGIRNAIEALSAGEPVGTTATEQIWHVSRPRNPFFTGRDLILDNLHQTLRTANQGIRGQVIAGLGGIGKTQTALEYAYRYRHLYEFVFWVDASTTVELTSGFLAIGDLLRLKYHASQTDAAIAAVKRWLQTHSDWLLIFDNADQPQCLKPFMPTELGGHVLITSRAQVFDFLGITRPIEMPSLPQEDAVAFLVKRTDRHNTETNERQAAETLANELDGLPLALEQAGDYILANNVRFQPYLDTFRKRQLELLEKHTPVTGDYPATVATTWELNFSEVEQISPASAEVLQLSAFLSPDDIPFTLLANGASKLGPTLKRLLAKSDHEPTVVNETLEPVVRYSLVRVDPKSERYSIHRLVQQIIKDRMTSRKHGLWAKRTVEALAQAFPEVEYPNWPQCEQFLAHAQVASRLIREHNLVFSEAALLLNQTGLYLYYRGQYALAEPLYKQAIEILRTAVGEEHPDFATSLNNLARVYRFTGHYQKAEDLFKRALEIRRTVLGEDHPDYATSLHYLARLYRARGRYKEASPLFIKALDIRRNVLGEEHPDFASSLNKLAALYLDTGRYKEAEPLIIQALEILGTALGKKHPDFATSLNYQAKLYHRTGRYEESEELFIRALKIGRDALEDSHPRFASSVNNLARLYHTMGRYAEAEKRFEQALEIRREALGETHSDYASTFNDLAALYDSMRRYEEAEPLLQQAIEIFRTALGEQHPDFASSLSNRATLYRSMGRYEEAEPLFRQALDIYRTALGENHPDFATSLINLALLYSSTGRYEQAEPLYKQAVEIFRTALGEEHPHFANSLEDYAGLLRAMKRDHDADEFDAQLQQLRTKR